MFNAKNATIKQIILTNLCLLFFLIFVFECCARVYLNFTRGSSTVGLPERTLYLNYKPFVMFGPDWDAQLSLSKHPALRNGKPVHRILLIGGSTAALFPKEVLESALQKKFPAVTFDVINAAEGGYIARQEIIVASIWGAALAPDVIISIDGANDLTHRLRMENADTFFLNSAYELALTKPFLSPFAHILRHSQLVQGMQRAGERLHIGSLEKYTDAIPVYISAQHSINALATGLSAKRIMVLQPFMAFKTPLSKDEASFNAYQYREKIIMQLYNLANDQLEVLAKQDNVSYIDGRFIYNGVNTTLFSDDVHFVNQEGYQILAENIVNKITENDLTKVNI